MALGSHWAGLIASGRADDFKQTALLPDFLTDIFCTLLGYTGPAGSNTVEFSDLSNALAAPPAPPLEERAGERRPFARRHVNSSAMPAGTGDSFTFSRERHVEVDGRFADAVLGCFQKDKEQFMAISDLEERRASGGGSRWILRHGTSGGAGWRSMALPKTSNVRPRIPLPTGAISGPPVSATRQFQEYKGKAEKGDAMSQFALGVCYDEGEGVAKDYAEAVKWYRKTATPCMPIPPPGCPEPGQG